MQTRSVGLLNFISHKMDQCASCPQWSSRLGVKGHLECIAHCHPPLMQATSACFTVSPASGPAKSKKSPSRLDQSSYRGPPQTLLGSSQAKTGTHETLHCSDDWWLRMAKDHGKQDSCLAQTRKSALPEFLHILVKSLTAKLEITQEVGDQGCLRFKKGPKKGKKNRHGDRNPIRLMEKG